MDDPIQEVKRQTQRYWYVDGLTELGAGALILLLGLLYLLIAVLGPSTTADWLMGIGQPGILLVGYLIVNSVIRQLKERITYPRTGYVTYRQPKGKLRVAQLIFTVLLAAGVAYMLSTLGINFGQNALLGLMLGAAVAYLGYDYGLRRFYALAAFMLAVGLLCAYLSLNDTYTMALFFGLCGTGWLVSGAATLRGYLRQTLPAADAEREP